MGPFPGGAHHPWSPERPSAGWHRGRGPIHLKQRTTTSGGLDVAPMVWKVLGPIPWLSALSLHLSSGWYRRCLTSLLVLPDLGSGVLLYLRGVGRATKNGSWAMVVGTPPAAFSGLRGRASSVWPLTLLNLSPGPVCSVLPTATLPLCPAAVPKAGGPAGPEELGAAEGHRGAGCACGHPAV